MPVISVPVELTSQKMLVGMQIIGRISDLDALFRVAYAYSRTSTKLFQSDLFPEPR